MSVFEWCPWWANVPLMGITNPSLAMISCIGSKVSIIASTCMLVIILFLHRQFLQTVRVVVYVQKPNVVTRNMNCYWFCFYTQTTWYDIKWTSQSVIAQYVGVATIATLTSSLYINVKVLGISIYCAVVISSGSIWPGPFDIGWWNIARVRSVITADLWRWCNAGFSSPSGGGQRCWRRPNGLSAPGSVLPRVPGHERYQCLEDARTVSDLTGQTTGVPHRLQPWACFLTRVCIPLLVCRAR